MIWLISWYVVGLIGTIFIFYVSNKVITLEHLIFALISSPWWIITIPILISIKFGDKVLFERKRK